VATKASQKATAYLALAYMRIKLLMMLTVAKTSELPEEGLGGSRMRCRKSISLMAS